MNTNHRSLMRTLVVAFSAACIVGGTTLPASACCSGPDPDEFTSKLDIEVASGFKDNAGAPLVLSIQTFEGWRDGLLQRGGPGKIFVYFDTTSDLVSDYVGRIKYGRGRLTMVIRGPGFASEPLQVRRRDARTIRVTVPGGSAPNPSSGVAFYFRTEFVGGVGDCVFLCADEAPDAPGWFGPI